MNLNHFTYGGFEFSYTPFIEGDRESEPKLKALLEKWKRSLDLTYFQSPDPVNWKHVIDLIDSGAGAEIAEIAKLLRAIGYLSISRMDAWEIRDMPGQSLNPRFNSTIYYFKRRVDVEAYASLEFNDAMYPWEITHCDKVVQKPRVQTAESLR